MCNGNYNMGKNASDAAIGDVICISPKAGPPGSVQVPQAQRWQVKIYHPHQRDTGNGALPVQIKMSSQKPERVFELTKHKSLIYLKTRTNLS